MDTKRTRIHYSRRRLLVCSGLLGLLLTSCDDPVAALIGVTAVSTASRVAPDPMTPTHTHRCAIPSSDLQDPPGNTNTYITTTSDGHSHVVTLSRDQLLTLDEPNGAVSVEAEPAVINNFAHTHTFHFVH